MERVMTMEIQTMTDNEQIAPKVDNCTMTEHEEQEYYTTHVEVKPHITSEPSPRAVEE